MEEDTIQIDSDELSDRVVEDLREEGILTKEEALEYGSQVRFEDFESGESNETGLLEYLKRKVTDFSHYYRDYRTVFVQVEKVYYSEDGMVTLDVESSRVSGRIRFESDSTELANLLKWKDIENPKNLEDDSIPVSRYSLENGRPSVLIPHNVSYSGQFRFNLYIKIEELLEKTYVRDEYEETIVVTMGALSCLSFASVFLGIFVADLGYSDYWPFVLVSLVAIAPVVLSMLFAFSRILLEFVRGATESNFYKILLED